MDSLVGYGSDDDNETERYGSHQSAVGAGNASGGAPRRREDDTNYDDVNMDMSEESQGGESEPELPPAEPAPSSRQSSRDDRRRSNDSRERDRDRDRDRRERRRESPPRSRPDKERNDRRSPRRDDRYRSSRGPNERDSKVPSLMDVKPFGGEPPPTHDPKRSHDARDAVSPRFVDRERRDRDRDRERERERERERDRERHGRRSEEKRSSNHRHSERPERRDRSRSRGAGASYPPPNHAASSNERRGSPPSGDYRPSSYKVNKKLEVMEKMGLQIKTPDGSMATAQQLRAAASEAPPTSSGGLPSYFNPSGINSNKILDQVQKRKLLWSHKNKTEAEEAAKWSGTRFAQDSDGKQVSKFMRLMGIKEPAAVKTEPDKTVDPIKKQEELFQAMQAQYEVARATTHTMRGVGLGFQRGQY